MPDIADNALLNTLNSTLKNLVIAVNNGTLTIEAALKEALPVVQSVSASATAGSNGAVPAQVFEYLVLTDPNGITVKVPAYKV